MTEKIIIKLEFEDFEGREGLKSLNARSAVGLALAEAGLNPMLSIMDTRRGERLTGEQLEALYELDPQDLQSAFEILRFAHSLYGSRAGIMLVSAAAETVANRKAYHYGYAIDASREKTTVGYHPLRWKAPESMTTQYEEPLEDHNRDQDKQTSWPTDNLGEPDKHLIKAKRAVSQFYNAKLLIDSTLPPLPMSEIYIVSFTHVLGNWKAMVSTDRTDGRYYEVTYNAAKEETYVDCYQKQHNVVYRDRDNLI